MLADTMAEWVGLKGSRFRWCVWRRSFRPTDPLARAALALVLCALLTSANAEAPKGYERLTRAQVLDAVERAGAAGSRADFYSKDLSNLDLSGIDFKGANLTAAVLNGSNLTHAKKNGKEKHIKN
jgi:uncharacterized protein YjbI with pentapeptide repeats